MTTLYLWDNYRQMPWKNGLGITREVCRNPETGDYNWRISIATIASSGPFSAFNGYLRNISVLEGAGMYLIIDGQKGPFLPPHTALDFDGNREVYCEVHAGPLLDFNVIYNQKTTRATVSWETPASLADKIDPQATHIMVFNAGHQAGILADNNPISLGHYDCVHLSMPCTFSIQSADKQCPLALVQIYNLTR